MFQNMGFVLRGLVVTTPCFDENQTLVLFFWKPSLIRQTVFCPALVLKYGKPTYADKYPTAREFFQKVSVIVDPGANYYLISWRRNLWFKFFSSSDYFYQNVLQVPRYN